MARFRQIRIAAAVEPDITCSCWANSGDVVKVYVEEVVGLRPSVARWRLPMLSMRKKRCTISPPSVDSDSLQSPSNKISQASKSDCLLGVSVRRRQFYNCQGEMAQNL